ncbi:MAG: hypothetical protein WC678_01205 [Parcubacteria group bacterium]|jgi:hypothetical protein
MAINLPAFCDNQKCGAIFPSGFIVDNAMNSMLSGNKSGPCPHCGGVGSIPDGVFNFVNNTIEIISAPQHTIDELNKLSKIIVEAIKNRESSQVVVEKIKRETPEFNQLAVMLFKIGGGLLMFLQIVNNIIDLKASFRDNQITNINQNITVNQVFDKFYQENKVIVNINESKIGRNDPCFCGAKHEDGRPVKFKKCHGK